LRFSILVNLSGLSGPSAAIPQHIALAQHLPGACDRQTLSQPHSIGAAFDAGDTHRLLAAEIGIEITLRDFGVRRVSSVLVAA
jgi:hypothetical protein